MKVSTRIQGRVTSISLNDSVCIMHYLLMEPKSKNLQEHMNDFVARHVLPHWSGDTAKGLSTFVTHCLIQDCLEPEDLEKYSTLRNILQEDKDVP